ncbi:BQ2448_662 [Microbotryum intermedium]|uniref:BQ2448_662 protein n=1 Tax=Microbotryum intermedium TaxID=269621 RepID=A0A238F8W2_9BASI|nr:BQ2448_662 [Microbotryum intermedium]
MSIRIASAKRIGWCTRAIPSTSTTWQLGRRNGLIVPGSQSGFGIAPHQRPSALRFFTQSHEALETKETASPRAQTSPAVISITNANVFPFGVPSDSPDSALFTSLSWTIQDPECWGIFSSSSALCKTHLIEALQAKARFDPPNAVIYPLLDSLPPVARPQAQGGPRDRSVQDLIGFVSFRTRLDQKTGEFEDYTSRYYAIRDEDKLTLRDHLKNYVPYQEEATKISIDRLIEETATSLEMETFLDLPLVTLSNGQTRRARIMRALLAKPELLILEEPYTGLDVASRSLLSEVLERLHSQRSPRILLVVRPQDPLPSFVTHLALIDPHTPRQITFGTASEILSLPEAQKMIEAGRKEREASASRKAERRRKAREEKGVGEVLVRLNKVNVVYGIGDKAREVLKDVSWTIREGERWVLAGHNGSGKSTLLSLILGDHPRSFVEDITLFGKPRSSYATATLQSHIGHVSPEIASSFPRKSLPAGLTVQESILTGFESIFCYRKPTSRQIDLLQSLLEAIQHPRLTAEFLKLGFAGLSPSDQSLVLLLRALVKQPKLLVLDEAFSGMDSNTIDIVKKYIDLGLGKDQAVIFISHFEEELPRSVNRSLMLDKGKVVLD